MIKPGTVFLSVLMEYLLNLKSTSHDFDAVRSIINQFTDKEVTASNISYAWKQLTVCKKWMLIATLKAAIANDWVPQNSDEKALLLKTLFKSEDASKTCSKREIQEALAELLAFDLENMGIIKVVEVFNE